MLMCCSFAICRICCMPFPLVRADASRDYKDWSNGSESQPAFIRLLCTPAWSLLLPLQGLLLESSVHF